LRIGATVKVEDAATALAAIDRDLGELVRRFGGWQVRNAATVGGNIANGSPIGDSPPALIALGAQLELQKGKKIRSLPLEDFFLDYKKQDRAPGEFVRAVTVRKLGEGEHFRCFKLSKRYDQDISAVMGAVKLRLEGDRIADVRIAFGGMAGTPKRAKQTEKRLSGLRIGDEAAIQTALAAIAQDFHPSTTCGQAPPIGRRRPGRLSQRHWRKLPERHPIQPAFSDGGQMHTLPEKARTEAADAPRTVRHSFAHDSAARHVAGSAAYIDDMLEPEGTLHLAPGGAPIARGRVKSLDLAAVRAAPGVVTVITAADIPGHNNIGAIVADEPLFAEQEVVFHGQPLFAVVARTYLAARRAAKLAKIEIEPEKPLVTVEDALAAGTRVLDDYDFIVGDAATAIATAQYSVKGTLQIGGQEHFYLEGQAALAIPLEGGDLHIHSSTQHPSEIQHIVAHLLDVRQTAITVEVRRMGGAFGGKESQATQWAAMAALAAHVTGRPCKIRLDRDNDMAMTGKRHDFRADYEVGFDEAATSSAMTCNSPPAAATRLISRPA
jgi:hypothetical protein